MDSRPTQTQQVFVLARGGADTHDSNTAPPNANASNSCIMVCQESVLAADGRGQMDGDVDWHVAGCRP